MQSFKNWWLACEREHRFIARSRRINESSMRKMEDRLGGDQLRAKGIRHASSDGSTMEYQSDEINSNMFSVMGRRLLVTKIIETSCLGYLIMKTLQKVYSGWLTVLLLYCFLLPAFSMYMALQSAREITELMDMLKCYTYDMRRGCDSQVGLFVPVDMLSIPGLDQLTRAMYVLDHLSYCYIAPVTALYCTYLTARAKEIIKMSMEPPIPMLNRGMIESCLPQGITVDNRGVEIALPMWYMLWHFVPTASSACVTAKGVRVRAVGNGVLYYSHVRQTIEEVYMATRKEAALVCDTGRIITHLCLVAAEICGQFACVGRVVREDLAISDESFRWRLLFDDPVSMDVVREIFPFMTSRMGKAYIGNQKDSQVTDAKWYEICSVKTVGMFHLESGTVLSCVKSFLWDSQGPGPSYIGDDSALERMNDWCQKGVARIFYCRDVNEASQLNWRIEKRRMINFLKKEDVHWGKDANLKMIYSEAVKGTDVITALLMSEINQVLYGNRILRAGNQRLILNERRLALLREYSEVLVTFNIRIPFLSTGAQRGNRNREATKTYLNSIQQVEEGMMAAGSQAIRVLCYRWILNGMSNVKVTGDYSRFFAPEAECRSEEVQREIDVNMPNEVRNLKFLPLVWKWGTVRVENGDSIEGCDQRDLTIVEKNGYLKQIDMEGSRVDERGNQEWNCRSLAREDVIESWGLKVDDLPFADGDTIK